MLFGPMAIAELKLPDDNPEAFKTCNGNYHSCITNFNATTAHLLSKDIQPILNCLAMAD